MAAASGRRRRAGAASMILPQSRATRAASPRIGLRAFVVFLIAGGAKLGL
jgi:hypothetical protein